MDATIAGLVGAGIGAVAGIAGALITHVLQARLERERWLRDKRVEAYTSAVRYLIRLSNKRSIITAEGVAVLGTDVVKEWFDDISDARSWLTSLLIYCSDRERPHLTVVIQSLNTAAADFIEAGSPPGRLVDSAQAACVQVAASARRDIGAGVLEA